MILITAAIVRTGPAITDCRITSHTREIEVEHAKITILDWSDDGYHLKVEHDNGYTEEVWLDGDLPKGVYFHRT